MTENRSDTDNPVRCALVGDESLVVQCAEIARAQGLHVVVVASHDAALLELERESGSAVVDLVVEPDLAAGLEPFEFDVLISAAYQRVISDAVLEQASTAINFHDGPLPAYAGLHVTSWAIANGESEHGVTWHLMTSDVDRGDVIAEVTFPIDADDTAFSLNARCFEAGADSFQGVAQALAERSLRAHPQPDLPGRTYRRRDRPIVFVDASLTATDLDRQCRALHLGNRVVNGLGLPRLVLGDDVYVVDRSTASDSSGAAPGAVVTLDDQAIRLAVTDGDLVMEHLLDPDGNIVGGPALADRHRLSPGSLIDGPRSSLVDALREADAALATAESFWRRRLTNGAPPMTFDVVDTDADSVRLTFDGTVTDTQLVSAAAVWQTTRTSDDRIAIRVVDAAARSQLGSLSPLLRAPELRMSVDSSATVSDFVESIGRHIDEALRHGPFLRDLVARDPSLRGTTEAPSLTIDLDGGPLVPAEVAGLHVVRVDERTVDVVGALGRDDLESVAEQVANAVEQLRSGAVETVGAVDVLGAADRRVLEALNDTSVPGDADSTIDALVRQRASEQPDAPALSCASTTITYKVLGDRVATLAASLVHAGVARGDRVGISVERSIDMVVSVLAVLECGAAYVPLDPDYPADRIRFMAEDSGLHVVITRNAHRATWDDRFTVIDPATVQPAEIDQESASPSHDSSDLAYVIYTSGSTGTPKGVQLEHRQVANFFVGMDTVIEHEDPGVWLAVTSLSFDISVLELLWTLTRGFHVVVKQDSGFRTGRRRAAPPTLSLFHFAAGGQQANDGYRLLLDSSRWADERGFEAVWTPERHFHDFGAPYPNPSVTAAAVAVATEHIAIRAGSVVLPLHSPVRVAEEWSVVDNLSGGRVGISFAAGWQPNDFVLNPSGYADASSALPDQISTVQRLWRGETVDLPGPDGNVAVCTLPRPVQKELPVWLTSAGSPASFERAGKLGVNLLTHLLGQSVEQLAANIGRYRAARREAGHDGDGHVTVMLHTYLAADSETACETAREPLIGYLGTAVGLLRNMASAFPTFSRSGSDADETFKSLDEMETRQLLEMAAERYLSTSGLFGTVEDAAGVIETMSDAGVNEVACLIDYGIDTDLVLESLELLGEVHRGLGDWAETSDETVATLVERYGVTHLQCTPSLAAMLAADPSERAALASVQHLLVGGEALPTELARDLVGTVGGRVTNMYGPTETTIWSLTHEIVEVPDGPVPIGRPIANTTVHVLDPHGRTVPIGVFGELFLGGAGVARGYLGRPELQAARFVDMTGAGRVYATGDIARVDRRGIVEFAGRADHQVKIRGHRIELGEIESVLDRHPAVARSVVVAGGDAEPTLTAFIVPATGASPDIDELRAHVGSALPDAMVPSRISTIATLPLTPNGKIDRAQLPSELEAAVVPVNTEYSDGAESIVAAEWTLQLGRPVGRDDNFFDIGGHSLLAVKVFRDLADQTGAQISLTDVFRFPTVRGFAAHLERLMSGASAEDSSEKPEISATDRGARRRRARRGGQS